MLDLERTTTGPVVLPAPPDRLAQAFAAHARQGWHRTGSAVDRSAVDRWSARRLGAFDVAELARIVGALATVTDTIDGVVR